MKVRILRDVCDYKEGDIGEIIREDDNDILVFVEGVDSELVDRQGGIWIPKRDLEFIFEDKIDIDKPLDSSFEHTR